MIFYIFFSGDWQLAAPEAYPPAFGIRQWIGTAGIKSDSAAGMGGSIYSAAADRHVCLSGRM